MIIILIILVLMLASAGFLLMVRRYDRALPEGKKEQALHFPPQTGLFAEEVEPKAEAEEKSHERRTMLVERANAGDTGALADARATGDAALYAEVLDACARAAERQGNLPALVKHIANSNDLRASARLAEAVMKSWQLAPDRRSTVEMIHIAALSDDAEMYEKAIALALEAWREEKLFSFRAEELIALIESQYWVLAAETRRTGAGHRLKRRLADARRDLAAATPAR